MIAAAARARDVNFQIGERATLFVDFASFVRHPFINVHVLREFARVVFTFLYICMALPDVQTPIVQILFGRGFVK